MTAPQHRSGGLDANARGVIVLVVAVVIGGALLIKAGGHSSGSAAPKAKTTTTISLSTTVPGGPATTLGSGAAHTPSEVSVIVLNGSGKAGVAKTASTALGTNNGYTMQSPGNAAATTPTTAVYYAPGYQPDAIAVANALGQGAAVVQPKPSTSLGSTVGGANTRAATSNVVVVLGANTPAVSTSTTTPSGTSTGSTSTTTTTH